MNMRTVTVTVCTGTACYILGGSELLTVKEKLPKRYSKYIILQGSSCMNRCGERSEKNRPPYVSVDGEIYGGVDMERLVELIMEAVGGDVC